MQKVFSDTLTTRMRGIMPFMQDTRMIGMIEPENNMEQKITL